MNDVALEHKIGVLLAYGFTVGARDPSVRLGTPGAYMVRENSGEEPQDEWVVVGDDLSALVDEAFNLVSSFAYFEAVLADVQAGGEGLLHTNGTGAGPMVGG